MCAIGEKQIIGIMTVVWLVLMINIIWQGTKEKWELDDAEKISQLEVANYTNQIMVVAVSEQGARLCLYERNDEYKRGEKKETIGDNSKETKESWRLVLETEALIGKNGLGKTKEGDGKTPVGAFKFTHCFGSMKNPGTKMKYTQVDESHYWVDDSRSKYYNQFISMDEVRQDWKSAEHIVAYGECYRYVLATSYNVEQIPGKGSAVFLHCTSEEAEATAGCIAVPEMYMKKIVMCVEPQCVLVIDVVENILSY